MRRLFSCLFCLLTVRVSAVLQPRYVTLNPRYGNNTSLPTATTSLITESIIQAPYGTTGIFGVPGHSACDISTDTNLVFAPAFTATVCNPSCHTVVLGGSPATSTNTPPSSCCYGCKIQANSVRLIYWSPEAIVPNASITAAPAPFTLVSDGFTFISPSVYVVYYNLQAVANCEPTDISLGGYSAATIAYPPYAISTFPECLYTQNPAPINYTQLYYPEANSLIGAYSVCNGDPVDPAASNLQANPVFIMPQGLVNYDPAWVDCNFASVQEFGIYDPPFVLTKAAGLGPAPPATPGSGPPPPPTPTPTVGPVILSTATAMMASQAPPAGSFSVPVPKPTVGPQSKSPVATPSPDTQPADPGKSGPSATPSADPQPADPGQSDPGATATVSPQPVDPGQGNPKSFAAPVQPPQNTSPLVGAPAAPKTVSVGSQPIQVAPSGGGIVIGSTTLAPGAQATVNGVPVQVSSGFVVAAGSTIPIPIVPVAAPPTIAGNPVTTAPGGGVIIGGNTITAGGAPAIISGTTISVLPSGAGIIVNGNTVGLPTVTPAPLVTVGGQPIQSAPNGGIIIGGSTATPGGAPITIAGTTFSVPPGASSIVVNGNTLTLPPLPAAPLTTFAGQPVQTAPGGAIIIGGTTITPGGPAATISGTAISALPGGGGIVVGGSSTLYLPTAVPTAVDIGSVTVTEGASAVTISGVLVSLGVSGLEIGSSLVPLAPDATGSVGGIIFSALGGGLPVQPLTAPAGGATGSQPGATYSVGMFTGGGSEAKGGVLIWVQGMVLLTTLWAVVVI